MLRRHRLEEDASFSMQNCAMNRVLQEYPSYGLGDMREGALIVRRQDGTASCDLRLVSAEVTEGKYGISGLPAAFGDNARTLRLTLRDELLNMTLTLLYAIFDDCDVIARSAVITNEGSALLVLERADSLCLELPDDRYDLITLSGDWARERDVIRRRLNPGHQGVSSLRGASSHQASPFAALVYSGSFFATVDVDEQRCTRLRMGLNDRHFRWTLSAGKSFHVPEAVLAYSTHGMDGMSAQFHTLCREHIVRGRYAHAPRPILLNNWEATYFNFDEDKLVNIAEKAAQMGIELFVLDDGWFGHRDDDRTSLRDWTVDHRKLPNGLRRLADRVHAMGMKLGLWFEPEMVSPDSVLSREDVCDFIYRAVADVLRENGIDNVKWDMNRNISNVGSTALTAMRMPELPHRYILPEVLFESCASGGGRFDLGMLHYMPQTWCSDNTDAVSRCRIQYGTSMVFPPFAMGAHFSAVPNHQTGRITPLMTRALVAMSGCFGFELDLNLLSGEELARVQQVVARVKALRETLLYGDFHRLLSPFEGHDTAWITVPGDRQEAILMALRDLAHPNGPPLQVQLSAFIRTGCTAWRRPVKSTAATS